MNNMKEKILIIAHAGGAKDVPENTMTAFKKSIELGAEYVEFDIHLTKDDEIVIIHDSDTYRTTNVKGLVKEMTLNEIKHLKVEGFEKIPTLKELIALAKGKILLQPEIKAMGVAEKLIPILENENLLQTTIISSFILNELISCQKMNSEAKLALLIPEQFRSIRLMKRKILDIAKNNFYAIHPHFRYLTKEIVDFAHDNGLKVNVWTVNDENMMHSLVNMGIDGLITDDVLLAKKVLNNRK
ncbi:MAG: glycerophosphodiester phosphodiesterase [Promethearchaeota archaeon]